MGLARRLLVRLVSTFLCLQDVLIIALGTATFGAWIVISTVNGGQREPWMEAVGTWAWRTAFTFVPLGIAALILAGPQMSPKDAHRPDLPIAGLALLLGSLIGLAALSIIAASPLIAVWGEVYEWLNASGAWTELRGAWSSQFGGVVLAPFVPVALVVFLELAPAASMVAGSVALLILYFSRAAHFPRLFLASVLSQGAFVAASFYILDLTSYLTPLLLRELSEDVGFGPAIDWLRRHNAAAGPATGYLGWLFLGYVAWAPVLFWARRQAAQHTGSATATNQSTVRFRESNESEREYARPASDAPGRKLFVRRFHWLFLPPRSLHAPGPLERRLIVGIRLVFLVFGVVILFELVENLLATRARYVSSSPSPGAIVDQFPDHVTISFSHALDPTSSISVHLAASPTPSGELSFPNRQVTTWAGIDSHDLRGRSLRADLISDLPAGLYRVAWRSVAKNERASRSGTFVFGVGIPAHILRDVGSPLRERDPSTLTEPGSDPHATLLISGLLFLVLAAALPWLLRRTDRRL
jgi:methionine-rich copper-binding protein CopC